MDLQKALQDEYIKLQLNRFSEYRKEFLKETEHEEIMIVILKTHLYIEQEMKELTKIYFKHPKSFKDYGFKNRLDLLFGLGVIEKELYDPIKAINEVRNGVGHNLKFVYSEDNYKKIYDSLSKELLREFKKDLEVANWFDKDQNYIEKTKLLLACIWTNIKANVLTSFMHKQELAKEYETQALDELIEFQKSKK